MKSNNFVTNERSLIQSVINYNNSPEFIRSSLGGYPKYFLHIVIDNKHYFGLSKFCAFNKITLLDYIDEYRYSTNGGTTQKYIARLCQKQWIPYNEVKTLVRKEFNRWINDCFPNYKKTQSNFITIESTTKIPLGNKIGKINPSYLKLIGDKGENIAFKYESERIGLKGEIDHVSLKNDCAGYDIYSKKGKEERFIEVKTSINKFFEFYITSNETETLKRLKECAFLYLVTITDLEKEIGTVEEIKNPWNTLLKKGKMEPVSFKFKF